MHTKVIQKFPKRKKLSFQSNILIINIFANSPEIVNSSDNFIGQVWISCTLCNIIHLIYILYRLYVLVR